jgi:hypothetical protein
MIDGPPGSFPARGALFKEGEMGKVNVKVLDPNIKAVYGETMHVLEEDVAKGVASGKWETIPEVKEMAPAHGKIYQTKDFLSYRDVYGEDKKR